jgi:hypothetical protein
MSAAAKNLEAIQRAIVQHNGNCNFPIIEIAMSPFEVERLGWDDFNGIPIVADEKLPTGRFSLRCEGDHAKDPEIDAFETVERGEEIKV